MRIEAAANHLLKLLLDNPNMSYPRDIACDINQLNAIGCAGDDYIIVVNKYGTHSGYRRIQLGLESACYSIKNYKDAVIMKFHVYNVQGTGIFREAYGTIEEITLDELKGMENEPSDDNETYEERCDRVKHGHKFIKCKTCSGDGNLGIFNNITCDECLSHYETYLRSV